MVFIFKNRHARQFRLDCIGNSNSRSLNRTVFAHVNRQVASRVCSAKQRRVHRKRSLAPRHDPRRHQHKGVFLRRRRRINFDKHAIQDNLGAVELASAKFDFQGGFGNGIARYRTDFTFKHGLLRNRTRRFREEPDGIAFFFISRILVLHPNGIATEEVHVRESLVACRSRKPSAFEVTQRFVHARKGHINRVTGARIEQLHRHRRIGSAVLVAQLNLELEGTVNRSRARHGVAVFLHQQQLALGTVTLAELHVIGAVHKSATTVRLAFVTFRIRAGKQSHVHLVGTDLHLGRNIKVELARFVIVDGSLCHLFLGKRHTVHPDTRHVTAFRNQGRTGEMHGARRRINLHVGPIRHVERRIISHNHVVMSSLRCHFLVRRAEARDKFILAVDHDVGVHRSLFDIALVLVPFRNTCIISTINVTFMRIPRPVAKTHLETLLGRSTQGFALAILVNTAREAKVNTHTGRRLDGRTTQRNRNIPVVFARRRIVGIFKFHRNRMTQVITQ